jgi:CBS-domain-containing membrane protein
MGDASRPRMMIDLAILRGWVATALSLGALFALLILADESLLLPSFGGSCVILFGMPQSEMAQPRSLIGGHVVASVVGLVFLHVAGDGAWALALAVATALALMMLTRTVHSPAGADPIVVMLGHASWEFLVQPLALGLAALALGAFLFNNFARGPRWPARWT